MILSWIKDLQNFEPWIYGGKFLSQEFLTSQDVRVSIFRKDSFGQWQVTKCF